MDLKRDTEATLPTQDCQVFQVEIAGVDLVFKTVKFSDATPTGSQIAAAAGFKPDQHVTVLKFLPNGELEDLRPLEQARLLSGLNRFIAVESDRSLRLTIDGVRFDWPCSVVTGSQLRRLGAVEASKDLLFERKDVADTLVEDHQLINLDAPGVEAFYSRARTWELKVQDIRLEFSTPEVLVSTAMTKAGFDVTQEWHIFLKVVGQPKKAVALTTVIDLRTPGIEKLRLTPKDINNGEGVRPKRRDFALQEVDEGFLDRTYATWETVIEGAKRWLLIHFYPVPEGFNRATVTLALSVPGNYPGAQIDMFFVCEALALSSGRPIPATTSRAVIQGRTFQRWSRHRNGATQWKPATDNIITHLALVDESLLREVE